jgi:hypothetical protein
MHLPCIPATEPERSLFPIMHRWGDDTPDPGGERVLYVTSAAFVASFTSCGKCLYLLAINVHEHSEIRTCGASEHLLTTIFSTSTSQQR